VRAELSVAESEYTMEATGEGEIEMVPKSVAVKKEVGVDAEETVGSAEEVSRGVGDWEEPTVSLAIWVAVAAVVGERVKEKAAERVGARDVTELGETLCDVWVVGEAEESAESLAAALTVSVTEGVRTEEVEREACSVTVGGAVALKDAVEEGEETADPEARAVALARVVRVTSGDTEAWGVEELASVPAGEAEAFSDSVGSCVRLAFTEAVAAEESVAAALAVKHKLAELPRDALLSKLIEGSLVAEADSNSDCVANKVATGVEEKAGEKVGATVLSLLPVIEAGALKEASRVEFTDALPSALDVTLADGDSVASTDLLASEEGDWLGSEEKVPVAVEVSVCVLEGVTVQDWVGESVVEGVFDCVEDVVGDTLGVLLAVHVPVRVGVSVSEVEGVGDPVGVCDKDSVEVAVPLRVGVPVSVCVGVTEGVSLLVGEADSVDDGLALGVTEGLVLSVEVAVTVGVSVGVVVSEADGVGGGVGLALSVEVAVTEGVSVGVGVSEADGVGGGVRLVLAVEVSLQDGDSVGV
jgi:hypothetical protein